MSNDKLSENIILIEEKDEDRPVQRVRSKVLREKSKEEEIIERFETQLAGEQEMFEMQDYSVCFTFHYSFNISLNKIT